MLYGLIFILELLSFPQGGKVSGGTIPVKWYPLYRAASDLGNNKTEDASAMLSSYFSDKTSADALQLQDFANGLMFGFYVCRGNTNKAESFFSKIRTYKAEILKSLVENWFSENLLVSSEPYVVNLKTLMSSRVFALCGAGGRIYITEKLYNTVSDTVLKNKLDLQISKEAALHPEIDYKSFKSIAALRVLAAQKLNAKLKAQIWPPESENELLRLMKVNNKLTPFPDTYPWRISMLLPLTGRYAAAGKQVMYGVLAARISFPGIELKIYDTESSPAKTVKLYIEKVLGEDKPLFCIAPPQKTALILLLKYKTDDLPLIYPGNAENIPVSNVKNLFFLQESYFKRSFVLASLAYAAGARKFAVLYPSTAYGRRFASAFKNAVSEIKGKILIFKSYNPLKMPRRFKLPGVNAVFVPDLAVNIESVARRIAAGGRFPAPLNKKGRGLLLLATGEGLSSSVLSSGHRYFSGAYFSPGFYPDISQPVFSSMKKIFATWGIRRIMTYAADTWSFYKTAYYLIDGANITGRLFASSLRKLTAGPGMGALFDKNGISQKSPRIYRFIHGKLIKVVY